MKLLLCLLKGNNVDTGKWTQKVRSNLLPVFFISVLPNLDNHTPKYTASHPKYLPPVTPIGTMLKLADNYFP